MRPRTGLMFAFIICAFVFGFAGRAAAVKNLWQVALEEIEGHSGNIGNYTPGTVIEFDRNELVQKFEGILATFTVP